MLVDAQPRPRITSRLVSTSSDDVGGPGRTLCVGEALVDPIWERPIDGLAQAAAFVPQSGGASG
jgi:hypothetical protein